MKRYVYPSRIVATEGDVTNAEALLLEKTLQIGLAEKELIVFKGKASVILDFGKELAGGARVLTYGAKGNKKVRFRFGESVSETCAELGEKHACNDHSNRDFEAILQSYSDMTFGQSGFRFLRIDTLDEEAEIKLKTVVAATSIDERKEVGYFECDDEKVNEIWKTATYTLRLCLQNGYFWDGIKRDRLVWIGDLYPEMRAAHCLFGDIPETENSLRYAMNGRPANSWMDGIPAYSLWWLIILAEEYSLRKDTAWAEEFIPYAEEVLAFVDGFIGEDGTTDYPQNFVDWPTKYTEGEPIEKKTDSAAGVYYLNKKTLEKVKCLPLSKAALARVTAMEARLSKHQPKVVKYKQISGIGVWAGDLSKNNEKIILEGGAQGMSTFLSYFILTGAAAYGKYDEALCMLKDYYGGMLSVGATSFWEDFDLEWLKDAGRIDELPVAGKKDIHGDYGKFCYRGFRHSFCHGWSAGVVPFLAETVLGVKPLEKGFKKVAIAPKLCGLKRVRGGVPTPYGLIEVEHILQSDGQVKTTYFAPKEMEIVLK